MATAALGYEAAAFTTTQWKELERQAMIYKYMVASVPVPPYLLLPPDSSSDKDPEIGRCKRTDGKKWRCSRDVAPHQKYCERHMHRGRPRSRKPVELAPTNKKTRLHLSPATVSTAAPQPQPPSPRLLGSPISGNQLDNSSSILLNNTSDTSLSLYNRGMELMMSKDTCEQQLEKYMNGGFMYTSTINPSIFEQNHGEEEQLNLLSLPDIGNSYNDEFNLFLNPYDQPPRDFIDAWSNDNNPNSKINDTNYSSSANGNLSPSLNLSMATTVGDSLDDELGEIQMGETRDVTNQRCQILSWLSPVSWIDSEPGGPLAEVLRPSNVYINSDQGCGYTGKNGDGDAISPPATSASSSPSGVLHRTMLSLSDTSVCNSPTLAAAAASSAAPEIVGFQCLG